MADKKRTSYSLDELLTLQRALVPYIGEKNATKFVTDRFASDQEYGLPYTKTNLEAEPWRYMPPEGAKGNISVVPRSEMKYGVMGDYGLLGIRVQDQYNYGHPPANTLVHEGQHWRDAHQAPFRSIDKNRVKTPPTGISDTAKYNQESEAYRSDVLNEILRKTYEKLPSDSRGLTGRLMTGEIVPELKTYESHLPAGQKIQGTDFFRSLSNQAKAALMRYFYPTPSGYDAITGQLE